MGIWSDGKIICGCQIFLDQDFVDKIKDYDKNFTLMEKRIDSGGYIEEDIENIEKSVNIWLKKNFPNIRIVSSSPTYDADCEHRRYYLTFKTRLTNPREIFSIKDIIKEFESLDIETYKIVFGILFPNETNNDPEVFAVAHIW